MNFSQYFHSTNTIDRKGYIFSEMIQDAIILFSIQISIKSLKLKFFSNTTVVCWLQRRLEMENKKLLWIVILVIYLQLGASNIN